MASKSALSFNRGVSYNNQNAGGDGNTIKISNTEYMNQMKN